MRISILNCPIDALTLDETVKKVEQTIADKRQMHHVVVNAVKLVNMRKDRQLYRSVVSADLINSDGAGVLWLAKRLKTPFPERVTGIDLMQTLVANAAGKGWRCFFLGAREEVVKEVVRKYSGQYGKSIVAGYRNGYFSEEEENSIVDQISSSGADILFVAISSPKKENFLHKHRERLKKVSFIMGVGGAFDVVSGKVRRAPRWMQKRGLEWMFRFIQEPCRIRYFLPPLFRFFWYSVGEIVSSKRNKRNIA
jgi:N-acetylglucosaminyldiphosphoundecaprenol N-acetyl-beta-D-mannosaminyltransferase